MAADLATPSTIITAKIKTMFAELIPDDKLQAYVEDEIRTFMKGELREIIKKEAGDALRPEIRTLLENYNWTESGRPVATEFVKELVKKNATQIVELFFADVLQNALNQLRPTGY